MQPGPGEAWGGKHLSVGAGRGVARPPLSPELLNLGKHVRCLRGQIAAARSCYQSGQRSGRRW